MKVLRQNHPLRFQNSVGIFMRKRQGQLHDTRLSHSIQQNCASFGEFLDDYMTLLRTKSGILLVLVAFVSSEVSAQYYTQKSHNLSHRDSVELRQLEDWKNSGNVNRLGDDMGGPSNAGQSPRRPLEVTRDSSLVEVGSWLWGACNGAAVKDSFTFIGNGIYVHTLNTARIDSPYIVGEYVTDDVVVKDIVVRDSLLYVLTGRYLIVLDCRNPLSLQKIAEIQVSGTTTWRLLLCGQRAYAGTYYGIEVIDISTPSSPALLGYLGTGEETISFAATLSGTMYVGYMFGDGFDVFDASDPSNILYDTSITPDLEAWGLAVRDTILYACGRMRGGTVPGILKTYDIAESSAPAQLGIDTFFVGQGPYSVMVLDTTRMLAYATSSTAGLYSIDIHDPGKPKTLGHVIHTPSTRPLNGSATGGVVAISTGADVWLVNASDANALVDGAVFLTGSFPQELVVKGNFVYLLASSLSVLDISDPTHPVKVAGLLIAQGGPQGRLALNGNDLYIPLNSIGVGQLLHIVNISDPYHPRSVKTITLHDIGFLAVDGNKLYVTINDTGFVVFDVTDPENPVRQGTYRVPRTPPFVPLGVIASGPIVSVGLLDSAEFVDVSDPYAPIEVSAIGPRSLGGYMRDTLCYLVQPFDSTDISVYSLANPSAPTRIGAVHAGLYNISFEDMAYSDSFLYVDGYALDVSDPRNPRVTGYVPPWIFMYGIAAKDNYVYYSDDRGFHVLRNSLITSVANRPRTLPLKFALEQNYPNPFNPVTEIVYDLPSRSHVSLKIYDLLGQVVTSLANGVHDAGYKQVAWNAGNCASGIYFYRLEATSVNDPGHRFSQTKKMILLR